MYSNLAVWVPDQQQGYTVKFTGTDIHV